MWGWPMTTRDLARAICFFVARDAESSFMSYTGEHRVSAHRLLDLLHEKTSIPKKTLAMWVEDGNEAAGREVRRED
jgi:dTDP-4-dehydrorhamnose reductase